MTATLLLLFLLLLLRLKLREEEEEEEGKEMDCWAFGELRRREAEGFKECGLWIAMAMVKRKRAQREGDFSQNTAPESYLFLHIAMPWDFCWWKMGMENHGFLLDLPNGTGRVGWDPGQSIRIKFITTHFKFGSSIFILINF